jgi:hypothetical protein
MRPTLVLLLIAFAPPAFAQQEGAPPGAWLNLEYTYNNIAYSESAMNEKGNFAGLRGELGLGVGSSLGVSVGGEYMEGNLQYTGSTFTGTSAQTLTKDYIRDLRALLHMFMGQMELAGGVAQREWFDNLVVSNRRRETYDYYPAMITFYRDIIYFRLEYDLWSRGRNKAYMSDVNPAERDVDFSQSSGSGYGVEVGLTVPTAARFGVRAFLSYHRWDVNDSDVQNDNVYTLKEPKNNTVTISGGLGVSF